MQTIRYTRGFTLIEILVVVIIIATIVSIALLSMSLVGDDRELDTERQRLAAIIEIAQDEAMLQGREFGIEMMRSGYRFVEFDPLTSQWAEVPGDDLLRQRELPEGMEFELYVEDKRIPLELDPRQFEDPEEQDMSGSIEDYEPHLFLFSSGDATAYEIRLRRDINDQELVMRGDIFGDIEFANPDE